MDITWTEATASKVCQRFASVQSKAYKVTIISAYSQVPSSQVNFHTLSSAQEAGAIDK
jgi:hypothetical protein